MTRPIHPKVTAATLASAVAGLVLWVLDTYVLTPSIQDDVPLAVAVFVTTLAAFVAGYAQPATPGRGIARNRKT